MRDWFVLEPLVEATNPFQVIRSISTPEWSVQSMHTLSRGRRIGVIELLWRRLRRNIILPLLDGGHLGLATRMAGHRVPRAGGQNCARGLMPSSGRGKRHRTGVWRSSEWLSRLGELVRGGGERRGGVGLLVNVLARTGPIR